MSGPVSDYLQFEGGVIGALRRFGWSGPWPPPERMGIAIGRQTKIESVFDDMTLTPELRVKLGEKADVSIYDRVSYSGLPPQEEGSRVARGALYRPVGEQLRAMRRVEARESLAEATSEELSLALIAAQARMKRALAGDYGAVKMAATAGYEAIKAELDRRASEASAVRDDARQERAVMLARERYGNDDCEILAEPWPVGVESVDGGYWITARVWVDFESVEEGGGDAEKQGT